MNFGRNAEIFAEGEAAGYVYKIGPGVVRVSKLLPDGRRQISAFHLPGDMSTFSRPTTSTTTPPRHRPRQVGRVQMAEPAERQRSNSFVHEMLNRTMIGLRQTQDHLLLLGRKNALERLVAFLLEMAGRSGNDSVLDLAMPLPRYCRLSGPDA
ncbi:MAG: hypothetical protein R3D30_10055 [Hyphomicrobiales bacterium]